MKNFIILFFLITQCTLYGQLGWVQKDSLPSAGRFFHISFVIGDKAYAGLGAIDAEQRIYSAGFFRYDPSGDFWEQLADYPGKGRYASTAFSLNGKGYICLGVDTNHMWQSEVWEFDPVTEAWTKKTNFPGGDRYSSSSFVIDNKAYVVGGSYNAGQDYLNDLWCYNPATDTWMQKTSLPTAHKSGPVAFSINGKGYVCCGAYSTEEPAKDFYEYNPETDSWSTLPNLPGLRTGAVGFVIGDKAYVGTGTDLNLTYKSFWCFNPTTNNWNAIADPPAGFSERTAGSAFSIGNTGYVLAGRSRPYDPFYDSGKMLHDLWAYTPCMLPVAGFTYQANKFVVNFSDSSTGATQYYWDFGDETHSTEKDPVHTFTTGVFNVCQTVINSCGQDSVCKSIQITCPNPVARFFSSYGYPEAQFTDSSTNGFLISRLWDFGDSTSSTEPNPLHSYNYPGIYQVCLTITDSCGSDTTCDNIYLLLPLTLHITITPAATNDLLAQFSDLTPGTSYWKWKFGDGDSSESQNPSHLFKEYGTYRICLTAGNNQYLGTLCDTLLLSVNPLLHMAQPVLVYPNPSSGKLFVRFYRSFSSARILVEDQSGRGVFDRQLFSPDLTSPSEIDLSGLSKGVYFVHVNCDNYKKVWKIVIL